MLVGRPDKATRWARRDAKMQNHEIMTPEPPGDERMNAASKWRLPLAQKVAAAYAANPKVAAAIVGGSTCRGHADRYSDIEVGVFWHEPPTDDDRRAAAEAAVAAASLGGEVHYLYPYDPAEEVWEDTLFLGRLAPDLPGTGVLVEIPHYTVEFMERVLDDVLVRHDPSNLKQNLLAVLAPAIPVHGEALIEAWRSRTAVYPRELALAVVRKYAQIEFLWTTEKFLERGNNLMLVYDVLVGISKQLIHVLFALNRTYYSGFKWIDLQISSMKIIPPDFIKRLQAVFASEPLAGAEELRTLVEETYSLIEKEMPEIDVARLRWLFRYRRELWDGPPPKLP
jgi:hypothetical protein